MLLSSRLSIAQWLFVSFFLFVTVSDATAARRSVRVDFNAWSEAMPIDSCSGYTYSFGALRLENAQFRGSYIPGPPHLDPWKSTSYCQTSTPFSEGLTTSEYLNRKVFLGDESELAYAIGKNDSSLESHNVSARKYSFITQFGSGVQWTFYDFPRSVDYPDGLTLVGYYSSELDPSPRVSSADGEIRYWGNINSEEYDGEYFCFENGVFIGVSDGSTECKDPSVPEAEREALVALYNSTDGPNWRFNDNWLEGDPCLNFWRGVTCEKMISQFGEELVSRTVTELELNDNSLNGNIPQELGSLSSLRRLELGNNDLTGNIPQELGNLSELNSLFLHDNHLSGNIPRKLGDLTRLDELDLSSNALTGIIPDSLSVFSSLWRLDLNWNGLRTADSALDSILDLGHYSGDWSVTQTIPPVNVSITGVGPLSISLSWDAIEYTGDTGRYRVWYSTSPSGPFEDSGVTDSKLDTTHTITGLIVDRPFYVKVRSETDSHDYNQNAIESEDSELVSSDIILSNGFE